MLLLVVYCCYYDVYVVLWCDVFVYVVDLLLAVWFDGFVRMVYMICYGGLL